MIDLIDRGTAIDIFNGEKFDEAFCNEYEVGYNDGIDFAVSTLSFLPSAQPERKTGKWVLNLQGNWACSICGNDPYHNNMKNMNFCPNCGAEMNRGDDDADT